MIAENIKEVEKKIIESCISSGRKRDDVTLVAVSKTKPIEYIEEAYKMGIRDFGENKAQELALKYDQLPKDIRWHMIGHLQRNKVKYIIDKVCLIHSVDSIRLAEQIDSEARKYAKKIDILAQVNVSCEESKFGISSEETIDFINDLSAFKNINVKGLMAIAPFTNYPENNRIFFKNLAKLYVDINTKNIDNIIMSDLSMGMTGDYQVAIEEGATLIRVGTGIFGERHYNKE